MRQIHPGLRLIFYTGSLLSLMAGIQLFLLSEQTETYFAWTIQSPLTATTLGAFYFGTMIFGFLSGRERLWANVRGPALGLLVFLTLTLLATALHLDKFHLTSPNWFSRAAAWLWMWIYFLMPPMLVIMLIMQMRIQGNEPERTSNIPAWTRTILFAHGIVGGMFGLLLFFTPQVIIPIWPWVLTPLTSKALSAWLISFSIVDFQTIWENDWQRVKIMSIGYIIFGVLPMIAMIRYANEVNWLSMVNMGYFAYLLIMLAFGMVGYLRTRQA